jgi:GxxExxY protein
MTLVLKWKWRRKIIYTGFLDCIARKGAKKGMTENELSKIIVDACFQVHRELGPGLFESVYEECLYYELVQRGLLVERQKEIPVFYKEVKMEIAFRADLIVEKKVIVEIKSQEGIAPVHQKQLLTYLRLTDTKLGLLVNFNEALIKDGIQRIVNNL